MSKVVEINSQEHLDQQLRSSKIVVVDFWADWCEPCKAIAPAFEKLALDWSRPKVITFATVDEENNKPLAEKYQVNTLPTIILFENGKESQRMRGVDFDSLKGMTEKFTKAAGEAWTSGSSRGYYDITDQVEVQGLELLNSDAEFGSARTLFSDDKPSGAQKGDSRDKGKGKAQDGATGERDWVESDTDSQLMLFIPFQGSSKVQSIHVTSYATPRTDDDEDDDEDIPARPKRIEIYTNRIHNLGFEEAEDVTATQSIILSDKDWDENTKTAVIETRFVKFQKITSLVVFVVDAESDAEKTRIDRIRIFGESGEKRVMGKLQKVGDEPGE